MEFREPKKEYNVHRSLAASKNDAASSLVNANSFEKKVDVLISNEVCKSDGADAQILIRREAFDSLIESHEINRDNVVRVLDQVGIMNIPDATVLESYFFNLNTGKTGYIMPRENRIALIQNLLGPQNKAKYDSPSTLNDRSDVEHVLQSEKILSTGSSNENVFVNSSAKDGKGSWITGTEEGDIMLTKLFIHCGAQIHGGADIKLYSGSFRNMIDLRRKSLPSSSIVENVAEKLKFPNMVDFAEHAVNLRQFYDIIQGEIQGIWANYSAPQLARSLPTLCMVLVALAPIPMERICGTEVVGYLRSPKTVDYVLKVLNVNKGYGNKNSQSMTDRKFFSWNLEERNSEFARRRQPAPPLRPLSKKKEQSPATMPICPEIRSLATATNGILQRKSRSISESSGSTGLSTPRYMEPRPIDEISASIIARSKARKLIDKLRQNAIPTNRSECFARIKCVQKLIFRDANLSEDDESDDNEATSSIYGDTSVDCLHSRQPFVYSKVRPTGINGPLLPKMYNMGGMRRPITRKAHQETFERLYRSRFSSHSLCSSIMGGRSSSAPYLPSENDTRSSSLCWGQEAELPTSPSHAESPKMGEHLGRRRRLHSSLMLADIFKKRFFQCAPGKQSMHGCDHQSPKASSTTGMIGYLRGRRHTRPPVSKQHNMVASSGNEGLKKNSGNCCSREGGGSLGGMSLTRLGTSRLIPGAQGVFLTRQLKKFTPIEIAPAPDALAPPYVENLVTAPVHAISLRRFLALRHQFSTGRFFHVASAGGWHLVVPGGHAPLPDAAGLAAWRARHHHQYLRGRTRRKRVAGPHAISPTTAGGRASIHEEGEDDGGEVDEESELKGENGKVENGVATASLDTPPAQRLLVTPLSIPEEHLFEINDGVPWDLPPRDDLASPAYWKHTRERLSVYEDTSLRPDQEDSFISSIETKLSEQMGVTEEEEYAQRLQLFRSLTRKANVKLNVDDTSSLLTLVPLVDLNEGDELFLHYGREWWCQRLLASVFISVPDTEMRNVRWIELLFSKPTDVSRPFPLLRSAIASRKKKTSSTSDLRDNNKRRKSIEGKPVLFNMATQCRASDTEALVFSVRRSCVDREFFSSLVGDGSQPSKSVFDISQSEANVPMRYLRRALLRSLRGQIEGKETVEVNGEVEDDEENDDGSIVL